MTALAPPDDRFQEIATRIQSAALSIALEALDEDRQEYAREIERSASLKEEAEEEMRQFDLASSQRQTPNDMRPPSGSDVEVELREANGFVRMLLEDSIENGTFEDIFADPIEPIQVVTPGTTEVLEDAREALKTMLDQDWLASDLDDILDGKDQPSRPKVTCALTLSSARSIATALSTSSNRLKLLRTQVWEVERAIAEQTSKEQQLTREVKNAEKEVELLQKMKVESVKQQQAQALKCTAGMDLLSDNRLRISPVVQAPAPAFVNLPSPRDPVQKFEESWESPKKSLVLDNYALRRKMLDVKLAALAAEGHAAIDLEPSFWDRYNRPQIYPPTSARKNVTLRPLSMYTKPRELGQDGPSENEEKLRTNTQLDSAALPGSDEKIASKEKRPPHTYPNGAVYTGEWIGEKRHGRGLQVWSDGAKYEGDWVDDKAQGEGRFDHVGGDFYVGQWLDDKAHGVGTYTHVDGSTYVGQWTFDKQNGEGKEAWPDGASYVGEYKDGRKEGRGHFIWADGSVCTGNFLANQIHGHGLYTWEDGRKYDGQWERGQMTGRGKFTWPDGRIFEGDYVNDQKQGKGLFSWPDGRSYDGEWIGGKQHGQGTFTNTRGEKRNGEWNEGKLVSLT
mmetsp:Transcript_56050/g.122544  ORF Transcript_56050/g.122544 Transcript_56050/m.122544 type:complete len:622 (+) Transcript_56050:90-1955(+)